MRDADPDDLSPAERVFVAAMQANGGNATRAYLAAHPGIKASAAASAGWRMLRSVKVRAVLDRDRAERLGRYGIDGEFAMKLIALSAVADIADAYDDRGKLLAVKHWPECLRLVVKGIKANGDIVLHDQLKARELLAIAGGKLRQKVDVEHTFDHAGHLAELERRRSGTT